MSWGRLGRKPPTIARGANCTSPRSRTSFTNRSGPLTTSSTDACRASSWSSRSRSRRSTTRHRARRPDDDWRRHEQPDPALGDLELFRGCNPRGHRDRLTRRRAERHAAVACSLRRRRARRALESVLLENHPQPGRESARVRPAHRPVHVQAIPLVLALRAHRTAGPGVRPLAKGHRARCGDHRYARRVQAAQRGYLPRRTLGPGSDVRRRKVSDTTTLERLAELSARFARCPDLNNVVEHALAGIAELFAYEHSILLLLDESG